jgi:hypothetical protein
VAQEQSQKRTKHKKLTRILPASVDETEARNRQDQTATAFKSF